MRSSGSGLNQTVRSSSSPVEGEPGVGQGVAGQQAAEPGAAHAVRAGDRVQQPRGELPGRVVGVGGPEDAADLDVLDSFLCSSASGMRSPGRTPRAAASASDRPTCTGQGGPLSGTSRRPSASGTAGRGGPPAIQVTAGPPPRGVVGEVGELEGALHAAVGDLERGAGDGGDRRPQHDAQVGSSSSAARPRKSSTSSARYGSRTRPPLGPVSGSQRAWARTAASSPARRTASRTASSAVARISGGTTPASRVTTATTTRGQQQRAGVGAGPAADAGPVHRRAAAGAPSRGHPQVRGVGPAGLDGDHGRDREQATGQQQGEQRRPRPPTASAARRAGPARRRCRSGPAAARRPGWRARRRPHPPGAAAAGRPACWPSSTARISRRVIPSPRSRATSTARACRSQARAARRRRPAAAAAAGTSSRSAAGSAGPQRARRSGGRSRPRGW